MHKFVPPIRVQSQSYLKAVSQLSQSYLKAIAKSRPLRVLYKKNQANRTPRPARSSLKTISVRPHCGLTAVSKIRFPHKSAASNWPHSYLKVISRLSASSMKVQKTVAILIFELCEKPFSEGFRSRSYSEPAGPDRPQDPTHRL